MHHEPGPGDENNWWDRTSVYSSWLGASDEKLYKNWIKQIKQKTETYTIRFENLTILIKVVTFCSSQCLPWYTT